MAICADCDGTGRRRRRECPGCGGGGDSARWRLSRHEAAHVVVARVLGATRVRAKLLDRTNWRGWGGWTKYHLNGDRRRDEAVIILAGNATGGTPSPSDLRTARQLLRGSGTKFADAQADAAQLVHAHRREIDRTARQLLKHGRI